MAERYDETTVELVAEQIARAGGDRWDEYATDVGRREDLAGLWETAAVVLDALADAGLLVPPGATTVEVWEVRSQGGVVRKVYTRAEADAVMASCRPSMQQRTEITTRWAEVDGG